MSILALYAEENYAHGRDHEHLRAQVTAILTAAGFVTVGLALGQDAAMAAREYTMVAATALSALNLWLIALHTNRFDWHVAKAREARRRMTLIAVGDSWAQHEGQPTIDPCDIEPKGKAKKWGCLATSWSLVALLPVASVAYLLLQGHW